MASLPSAFSTQLKWYILKVAKKTPADPAARLRSDRATRGEIMAHYICECDCNQRKDAQQDCVGEECPMAHTNPSGCWKHYDKIEHKVDFSKARIVKCDLQ